MLLLACLATSGCTLLTAPVGAISGPAGFISEQIQYNETTDGLVVGWRNHVWSNKAWYQQRHLFADHCYVGDVGKGFRAGYLEVATGGQGCPPVLPPREYWSWRYQSPEGQGKTAAWFEGFPVGAAAAEKDGIANWGHIQTSYTASSKSIQGRTRFKDFLESHDKRTQPTGEDVPSRPAPVGPGFDPSPIPVLPRRKPPSETLPAPEDESKPSPAPAGEAPFDELPEVKKTTEQKPATRTLTDPRLETVSTWKPRGAATSASGSLKNTVSTEEIPAKSEKWTPAPTAENGPDLEQTQPARVVVAKAAGWRVDSSVQRAVKSTVVPAAEATKSASTSKQIEQAKIKPNSNWRRPTAVEAESSDDPDSGE